MTNQVLQRLSGLILLFDEATFAALLRLKFLLSGVFSDNHDIINSLLLCERCIINLKILKLVRFNQKLDHQSPKKTTGSNEQANQVLNEVQGLASDSKAT